MTTLSGTLSRKRVTQKMELRSSRPTMNDVARRAGVSLKTVSRVVNQEYGVASTTVDRVERAVDELGFQRNDLARTLRQGRSSATLGLVIEDIANPFYSAIALGVEAAARARGYLMFTCSCEEDPARERTVVRSLTGHRIDALIIVPAGRDHTYLRRELGPTVPIVFVDRPPEGLETDAVLLDNRGGARAAVEHLLAHGHRRIAYISDPVELYTAAERLAGYEEAMQRAASRSSAELIRLDSHDASGAEAVVRELLALPADHRPTALFTSNNRHTVGALGALRGVARRLALVGFDDFELGGVLGTTVVMHDARQLGDHAAHLAFARLDGDQTPPRHIVVETKLVERGSGEIPPA